MSCRKVFSFILTNSFPKLPIDGKLFSTSTAFFQQHHHQKSPNAVNKSEILRKQITLYHSSNGSAISSNDNAHQQYFDLYNSNRGGKPLTVLLAWLGAKEKHLEKYRQIWLQRGFDVLTVKMTPSQFILPKFGAKPLIANLIDYLHSTTETYPQKLFHSFSIGAYEIGEIIHQLNNNEENKDRKQKIEKTIKGIILDSPVNLNGAAKGIARSVTSNRSLMLIYELLLKTHLKLSTPFATKYYLEASEAMHRHPFKGVPSLVLVSESDPISTVEMSANLRNCWIDVGENLMEMKVFQKSNHCQHFAVYSDLYLKQIDLFLSNLSLLPQHLQQQQKQQEKQQEEEKPKRKQMIN